MKKLFTLVAVASLSLVACGPSAEEKAAAEKAKQDSIAAVDAANAAAEAAKAQAAADSVAAVAAAEAAKAQATADSIAAATAKKTVKAAKPKTIEQKVKEEAKKVESGRG